MQYHLNGFRPGDPEWFEDGRKNVRAPGTLPDKIDVLIVGCGPAGLTLAAQLAAFPEIETLIVERKPGPLQKGQADGISCRSMEMFNAFGFAGQILKQACWVNETTFWKPDHNAPTTITRNGRVQDVADGLSEMPHVILNQARIHDMYLELMRKSPSRLEPVYSISVTDILLTPEVDSTYPVEVTLVRLVDDVPTGEQITVRARYVVGCDGARSTVRHAIGRELIGDSANQAWGVMDVLAVTDFPDIRCKSLIQSAFEGNIIIIPREGGYLTRLYIELDKLNEGERIRNRHIDIDDLIGAAQRIFQPYRFDVKEVVWWSVYEIGQRLTDKFDDVPQAAVAHQLPHIFICGDACHTHSPKAGQGMNVSMGDAFNLGWKLVAVMKGISPPEILHTYSEERQSVAQDLINFDREWSRIMSERPELNDDSQENEPKFQRYFIQHGRYTAGMSVTYQPSRLTGITTWQELACGFIIGSRFHSAPVLRLADIKPVQLGHVIKSDARWRIFIFAADEDPYQASSAVNQLCVFLSEDSRSPLNRFTPPGGDCDDVFDVRVIFQQAASGLKLDQLSPCLFPQKGQYGLIDYEKIFCPDLRSGSDIFSVRGINRASGAVVVVRPDQYVAHILPLQAFDELSAFFAGFMLPVNKR
ncbi:FAD-binding monooxygenase [Acerihabitans sp. TG2]|uniref:FAD-binding monooxygenase n=1 Tax=Acerihabitans sp. TG2 TaxID=3096008 RepID=UPI002B225245|nr:FAD-binding monooxygenase [Acerihabitans sp. TG2]MEA9389767.1 FAD-binding monooxygenase [Acerihabitans sp. TG2]